MKRAEKEQVLVDRYFDFYTAALTMLKDADEAKDAVQDALVNTLVKHGVKDPYTYCMQAVRNRCVDTLRYRGQLRKLEENIRVVDPDREEMLRLVAKKKEELPPLSKNIIELHYEDGLSITEVGTKLGISESKVKRTLAKTKQQLKQQLEL